MLNDKHIGVRLAAAAAIKYHYRKYRNPDTFNGMTVLNERANKVYGTAINWLTRQLADADAYEKMCALVIISEMDDIYMKDNRMISKIIKMSQDILSEEYTTQLLGMAASKVLLKYTSMGFRIMRSHERKPEYEWIIKDVTKILLGDKSKNNNEYISQDKNVTEYERIKCSHLKAYLSYKYSVWRMTEDNKDHISRREPYDKDMYKYLISQGIRFSGTEQDVYTKYVMKDVPEAIKPQIRKMIHVLNKYDVKRINVKTWERYVRSIRKALAVNKNHTRYGREGRSVMKQRDV